MPGFIFLMAAWGMWVIATFILDKDLPFRLSAAVLPLLLIILQPVSFTVFTFKISAASFPLLFSAYLLIYQGSWLKRIYLFFSVMIIMFGYAGFYLFELYDPVWVIMDRKILLSVCLFIIGWILYPASLLYRYAALVIGTIHGEVFLSIFLSKWRMPYTIVSYEYLDVFALTVTAMLSAYAGEKLLKDLKKALEGKVRERKQIVH